MKHCVLIVMLTGIITLCSCYHEKQGSSHALRYISRAELEKSLSSLPISVGFDVDDTLLFSSPGFYYGMNNTDGTDGANKYGDIPLRTYAFWYDMNSMYDKFSIPKQSGTDLVAMHRKRGDRIFFITARRPTSNEFLTTILTNIFNLPDNAPVIFTGSSSKSGPIKAHGISLFYGDSDGDIRAAQQAGIRAVRVLRSPLSTNHRLPTPGKFGEEILENSEN